MKKVVLRKTRLKFFSMKNHKKNCTCTIFVLVQMDEEFTIIQTILPNNSLLYSETSTISSMYFSDFLLFQFFDFSVSLQYNSPHHIRHIKSDMLNFGFF